MPAVEHYEIAGYGSARDFAKLLGLNDIAALLDATLVEENADKDTHQRLKTGQFGSEEGRLVTA